MGTLENIHAWQKEEGIRYFRTLGIKEGDSAADYGCGTGLFTLPLSKACGDTGKVYGIDVKEECCQALAETKRQENLVNVCVINASDESLDDIRQLDHVLLFDLLQDLGDEKAHVLKQCYAMLKEGGLLHIAMFTIHLPMEDIEKSMKEVEDFGFTCVRVLDEGGIHMNRYQNHPETDIQVEDFERGPLYQFKKFSGYNPGKNT